MRKFTCISAALVAAFSFGLVACGDDGGTQGDATTQPETDTGVGADGDATSAETDATVATETTPGEVTPTDPCDPNPCTGKAAECNDAGAVVTYATPGTCTAEGTTASCAYTSTATPCEGGNVCAGGGCVAAGDACAYEFDERVSYVTSIAVGSQGADDTCCFDYTGDGEEDNSLGDLLKTAGGLLGLDINATIAEQIADGGLTLLLETEGVEDVNNDATVDVYGFYGEDSDGDMANNATGMGTFSVDPSSFQSGTATPLIGFEGGAIASGTLTAGPDLFRLALPVVGAQLDLTISLTKLEGKVAVGPNGNGLTIGADNALGGKLGGVIKRTDLYAALNAFIGTCTCVKFTNPGDTELIGEDGQCNAATTNDCGDADGQACKQLPPLCGTLLAFIDSDVDTSCWDSGAYVEGDCSGEKDAVSVGVWLKATSGSIDGVLECTP